MSSVGSNCERSSWLATDFLRLLRPLNSLDMRLRCADEVSLRPSSELRLFSLSNVPSADLCNSSSRWSLLATETADEPGPLEGVRLAGVVRLSLLATLCNDGSLGARLTAAMAGAVFGRVRTRKCLQVSQCACYSSGTHAVGLAQALLWVFACPRG